MDVSIASTGPPLAHTVLKTWKKTGALDIATESKVPYIGRLVLQLRILVLHFSQLSHY